MIRRKDELVTEIRNRMRGGMGDVEICHIFKQDELKGKARLVAKIKLEPGCSIGPHEHVDEEEIFYILKGTATVNDNGEINKLSPGDALLTGGGAMHSISNNSNDTLELMAVIILF
ncbi:MAG: cupin domain-containing protein [Clostridiaceae bacterium]|nr:cupin domain-containing protein [Clostridiaceae bacterium]